MKTKTTPILVAIMSLLIGSEIKLLISYDAISTENAQLRSQNDQMASTIATMKDNNVTLSRNAIEMQTENEDLREEMSGLLSEVDNLSMRLANANRQLNTVQEQYDDVMNSIEFNRNYDTSPTDITCVSGLSGEQFDELIDIIIDKRGLDGSNKLNDTGEAFEFIEEEYGINGLYVLAIFTHESLFAERCINTNNFGGIRGSESWKSFNTPNDCIYYEGKLLRESYVDQGRKTLSDIGEKYCEGSEWESRVGNILDDYIEWMEYVI
jgi:hypothetical protein